ncbi:MAG: aminopeptidase, partial [Calothrix sp. SM1_5_4]|nr:aminopeptidase [Calothrix sp. SM1_5_4]
MDLLIIRTGLAAVALAGAVGCHTGYYLHGAYNQSKLLHQRRPIEHALRDSRLSEESKRKLRLVQEVKKFAEEDLKLKPSRNYTTFVQLDEPYVTYIVQASDAWELKPYLWHFPLVGKVPYKGYFRKALAEEEAAGFDRSKYDVFVRGVSAYSTLGWLQDSVLSSMLRYDDTDLVETIIHETLHTTLYIKSAAEFNERMATFMGTRRDEAVL